MQFRVQKIDVTPMLNSGEKPMAVIKREVPLRKDTPFGPNTQAGASGTWYVPSGPVVQKDGIPNVQWSITKQGDYVSVPLYRYETSDDSPESLYGAGALIGAMALAELPERTDHRSQVTLFIGNVYKRQVQDGEAFEFYFGIAIRV